MTAQDLLGPLGLLVACIAVILAALRESPMWVSGAEHRRELRELRESFEKQLAERDKRIERLEQENTAWTQTALQLGQTNKVQAEVVARKTGESTAP